MKTCLLLGGGIDSTALCYWLRPTLALTVDYGQAAAAAEIRASRVICESLTIDHLVIDVSKPDLGVGWMSKNERLSPRVAPPSPEWWPFRNQLLLTYAASACVIYGLETVLIGTVKSDDTHADGSNQFIKCMNELLQCQEGAIRVEAPALRLSTLELVRKSSLPLELLGWTHSCHRFNYACGLCRGCNKHFEVWKELTTSASTQDAMLPDI